MKNILSQIPDKNLAAITRTVLTKRGRIVLDEATIGLLYKNKKGVTHFIVADSDDDFMRLDPKTAGRGHAISTAEHIHKARPALLSRIDPAATKKLQRRPQKSRPNPQKQNPAVDPQPRPKATQQRHPE